MKRSMDCPIHQQIEIYVYDTKCLLDIKDKQPYLKRAMVNKVHRPPCDSCICKVS